MTVGSCANAGKVFLLRVSADGVSVDSKNPVTIITGAPAALLRINRPSRMD